MDIQVSRSQDAKERLAKAERHRVVSSPYHANQSETDYVF